MLLKDALKYSDKVRRRVWPNNSYTTARLLGWDEHNQIWRQYHCDPQSDPYTDWEPVPLPGDITILCRECGEEFYIERPDCDGVNWTIGPHKSGNSGIRCPNCNTCY